ncbi:MAG: CopD family protein [Gemmatimonas sp.]
MSETIGAAALARLLLYVGALIAIGRGTVTFLDPEWAADGRAVHDASAPRWVARLGSLLLVLAPALLLFLQIEALEMTTADLPALLGETAWGRGWTQLTMASVIASVALLLGTGRTSSLLLIMSALGVAVAMGGLGHAAADAQWPLGARLLDAMHVAAMGAWIGGLLSTVLITRVPAFEARDVAWRQFSRTATVMAPVTVLTGIGSSARLLLGTPFGAIAASEYGRLLLLKTVLVLAVLLIGARQRARIQREQHPASRAVRLELGIAGAVFLVTALLTGSEPPSTD